MKLLRIITLSAVLSIFINANQVFGAPLGQITSGPLKIALSRIDKGKYQLNIKFPGVGADVEPQVFVVENPTRLVIDIPGKFGKSAQSLNLKDSELSSLRLGLHPDKTRIVVDIKKASSAEFSTKLEGEEVLVRFSLAVSTDDLFDDITEPDRSPTPLPTILKKPEVSKDKDDEDETISKEEISETELVKESEFSKQAIKKKLAELERVKEKAEKQVLPVSTPTPISAPKILATPTPVAAIKEEPAAILSPSPVPTLEVAPATKTIVSTGNTGPGETGLTETGPNTKTEPAVTEPANTGPAKSVTAASAAVKSIYYQTLKNTRVPAVAMDVTGLNSYTLNKIKSDLYELVIENATLQGKHLTLPQFPPDSFQGFEVIIAKQEVGRVVVKIYTDENAKLFPFTSGGQLWVKISLDKSGDKGVEKSGANP